MNAKLNPIERALVAAAGMAAPDSRSVLMMICASGMTTAKTVPQPTPGQLHYSKREKIIKRTKGACDRIIDYAKHETLRNVEKHFRESAIEAGEGEGHPFRGNQFTGGKSEPEGFSESKMRDKDGNLIVMYHGSSGSTMPQPGASVIDASFKPTGDKHTMWFTSDKETASAYGRHVHSVYLNIKHPAEQLTHFHSMLKGNQDGALAVHDDGTITAVVKNPEQIHRISTEVSAIHAAEGDNEKTLAVKLAFKKARFSEEMAAALREEATIALGIAGQQLFDEIGSDSVWKTPAADALAYLDSRENLFANASDEIHTDVMEQLQTGLDHGETKKELMSRIGSAFDGIKQTRADTIANTETAAAFNFSRDKAMREAGVTHKKWLHSQRPEQEPRPTHVENTGQTVPIDKPFDISGVKFMYPSDDSLGAGPEDIINCHCVAIPVEAPAKGKTLIEVFAEEDRLKAAGDLPGHPFRGNQYTEGEVEITQAQKAAQSFGRGSDAYRTSGKYDVKIKGIVKGRIWADKRGYMEKPFWNVATTYSDGSNIRTIHLATSYEKAVTWVKENHHRFTAP